LGWGEKDGEPSTSPGCAMLPWQCDRKLMAIALEIFNYVCRIARSRGLGRIKRARVSEEMARFCANCPDVAARAQLRNMLMRAAEAPDIYRAARKTFSCMPSVVSPPKWQVIISRLLALLPASSFPPGVFSHS
jgi:hypothetical protein